MDRENSLEETLKVLVGFIVCNILTIAIYLFETIIFHSIGSRHIIFDVRLGGNLTSPLSFFTGYLPVLIVLIILLSLSFIDYRQENFSNLRWKIILFILYYLSFEFSLLSKFINQLGLLIG